MCLLRVLFAIRIDSTRNGSQCQGGLVDVWMHRDGFSGTLLYYSLMEKNLKMAFDPSHLSLEWRATNFRIEPLLAWSVESPRSSASPFASRPKVRLRIDKTEVAGV